MIEPVYYRDIGAGPPLVLVHGGFAEGLGTWSAQVETLPSHHRLLIVDRRGHGASPREPRPYTIAGDATDLLQAADRAGIATFHLAGHSYGGLVAIEAARQAPGRLRSLHLIEPPLLALLPDDPDVRPLIEQGRTIFQYARAWGPERTAAAFFSLLLGPTGLAELRARPVWPAIIREARRLADEESPASYPPAALTELQLSVPVQVYTGGRSHAGLRKLAYRLAAILPATRLVDLPEAGHSVQRTSPLFERALLAVTRGEAGSEEISAL